MENAEWDWEQINQVKWRAFKNLLNIKKKILLMYRDIKEKAVIWKMSEWTEVAGIAKALCKYAFLFQMSSELQEKCAGFREILGRKETQNREPSEILENTFEIIELLEEYIGQRAKKCNVCGNDVFFTPIPAGYEAMRKQCHFLYWDADFQLESRENYGCPVCGAYDRDRLMIAFLEDIRNEGDEKLRMLQVAPSEAIERYALGREDILYESTDLMMPGVTFQADLQNMDTVEDETYDIIVCAHVLEHVRDDAKAMRELCRILKPDGVCLVLVPLIVGISETDEQWGCSVAENWRRFGQGDHSRLYGKEDFIKRLKYAGFYVNELGREWFGNEFYQEYGFDDLSILYVATKEIKLLEEKDEDYAKKLEKEIHDEVYESQIIADFSENV